MPELPEVETVCRQLEPEIIGREIERLEVLDARWSRPRSPLEFGAALSGRSIAGLRRRGKYILLGLEGGQTLVMHLRMTGNLILLKDGGMLDPAGRRLYEGERSISERHLRARFWLADSSQLWFTDPRRFGEAFLIDDVELPRRFERLGVEPLSAAFTPQLLGEIAAARTAPLKSFLLDQSAIAGVGNIYADEALFWARLHPLSPAGSMRQPHHAALRDAIVAALEEGIARGGASIEDYRDGRGERGMMQEEFLVHTREGQPCPACGGTIARIVVAGRCRLLIPAVSCDCGVDAVRFNIHLSGGCPARRLRQRQLSCAAFATGKQTASCTSTPRRGAGSARSPRARAGRSHASAVGWSPFFAPIWSCMRAAASCSP